MNRIQGHQPVLAEGVADLGSGYTDDDALQTKVTDIFQRVGANRTSDDNRLKIIKNATLTHTTSRGLTAGITPQVFGKNRIRLNHLFVDMKDFILHKKGINPARVNDFSIELHTRTCKFTNPDTGNKTIFDLHEFFHGDADGESLSKAYFDTAGQFFTPRYKFSKGQKGALNGKNQLMPSNEIIKKHGLVMGKEGFKNGASIILSHMIAYREKPELKKQIVERHALSSEMHKNMVEKLRELSKKKQSELDALKQQVPPADKKKLEELTQDCAHLARYKNELEKMDYFALNWALGMFPYVKYKSGETLQEIEDKLSEEIAANAKTMEEDLRTYQGIGHKEKVKKDPKEAALEEEYIRDNCAGLLFLTSHGHLKRCQREGIEKMKQESVEDLFVKEAIRSNNDVGDDKFGDSFRDYILPHLSKEAGVEFEQMLLQVKGATFAALNQLEPNLPDFNDVAIPKDDAELTAAKAKIAQAIISYETPGVG